MKIIKQNGNVRLVETIGNYMEYRYEIQEKYSYWKHNDDESPTFGWAMRCYSHDLKQAYEMYERYKITQV